jgi:hypothetical protein
MKPPKNLTQYQTQAIKAFSQYIKYGDREALLDALYEIRSHAKCWIRGKNKNIWFRFAEDDTLATTIKDIYEDTQGLNNKYLIEQMTYGVDNNSIQIYYS